MPKAVFVKSEFVKSASQKEDFLLNHPSVVMIGRSNVGKSTLINALVKRKQFMKTSKTPGHTNLVNYALIDDSFYLCDAPGYGFAKYQRDSFGPLMKSFLEENPGLKKVYLLIDSRRLLLPDDDEFATYLEHLSLPYSFVFTKYDKLKKEEKDHLKEQIEKVKPTTSFVVGLKDEKGYQALREDIVRSTRRA